MKRFTVTWRSEVRDNLAELTLAHWGTELGRQISDAANQIDRLLAADPLGVGTPLAANVRLLAVNSLAVSYAVYADDCMVVLLGYSLLVSN